MTKLKYIVEFNEEVGSVDDITDDEAVLIKEAIKEKIETFLKLAGFKIEDEIQIYFDVIEDDSVETW